MSVNLINLNLEGKKDAQSAVLIFVTTKQAYKIILEFDGDVEVAKYLHL
jgi:hypothetical protein